MKKFTRLAIAAFVTMTLAACANQGTNYRSDVYSTSQVNQAQEVETVEIIAIQPARVTVNNRNERSDAQTTGMVVGAIAGALIGNHNNHDTSSRVLGGLAGASLGSLAGSAASSRDQIVDGVQLVFRLPNGKVLQSTQVGKMCEYRIGQAIMVQGRSNETRIQPNNPYGCGR